jgi:tetratricopeptide (TPR) repeat protein
MAAREPDTARRWFEEAERHWREGDGVRAERLYRRCVGSRDAEWAPRAAQRLGELLLERGDLAGADAALDTAVGHGHPVWTPVALVTRGVVLDRRGDPDAAERLYREVVEGNHPDAAPTARFNLGELLVRRGRHDEAAAVFRETIADGHPDRAPRAAVNLGVLLSGRGDWDGARAAFGIAAASGHPEQAAMAEMNLGALAVLLGDEAGAAAAFDAAASRGEGPYAAESARRAHLVRAEALRAEGDAVRARLAAAGDGPEGDGARRDTMLWAVRLATELADGGEPGDAVGLFRVAHELARALLVRDADDPVALRTATRAAEGTTEALLDGGAAAESLGWARTTAEFAARLGAADPTSADGPLTASQAARHLGMAARTAATRGRRPDAAAGEREHELLRAAVAAAAEAHRREPDRRRTVLELAVASWELGTTEERLGRRSDAAAHAARTVDLLAPLEAAGDLPANCAPALAWARRAATPPERPRSRLIRRRRHDA